MATADTRGPVLAVAAEPREFDGLLKRTESAATLPWAVRFAMETVIAGGPWILLANGPGPGLAAAAIREALRHTKPRAMVSTGYCGGLDPALQIADLFIASEVLDSGTGRRFPALLPALCGARKGVLISVDRVAVTSAQRQALARTGASAVDMEASSVAAAAEQIGCPFFCIRGVSDTDREPLPLDFNQFRDQNGRFKHARIAAEAVLHPFLIPGLVRLARSARQASEKLGEFFADCPL